MKLSNKVVKNKVFAHLAQIGFIFIISILSLPSLAQNANFSQFHLAPTQTNVASIVTSNQTRVIFNYRSQFIGAGQAFVTPMISVIYPWLKGGVQRKGAFGLSFMQDKTGEQGVLTTTGGLASAAFNFTLNPLSAKENKSFLSVGLQGGYFQRRVNPDVLTTGNQWDGSLGYNQNTPINESLLAANANFPIFNAGLMYYVADTCANVKAYVGLNVQNLNRPNVGFFGEKILQPFHYTITAGLNVYNQGNFTIQPNLRWLQQGNTKQIRLGSLFYYNFANASGALADGKIGLGAWYDSNSAVALGFEFHQNNFFAGFAYDLGASNPIKTLGSGSIELSVGLKFGKKCLNNRDGGKLKDREPIRDTSVIEVKTPEGVNKITIVALIKGTEVLKTDTIAREFIPNQVANAIPTEEDLKMLKKQAFFYYLSEDINKATANLLDQIAAMMVKFKGVKIEIAGHTCDIGDDNQGLSIQRAKAVQKYLVSKGVEENRLELTGFGAERPILSNKTEYGRTKNRRVEFRVLTTGEQKN